jgi:integrase/recombinase XerD
MRISKYYQLKRKYRAVIQGFEAYLKKHRYEENTIRIYCNYTSWFLEWISKEQIQQENVVYNDILSMINTCKKEGNSNNLINRKIAAIRKYYEYLQFTDKTIINPASGLYLKGRKRTVPGDLLDKETLEKLYESYPVYDLRTQRNKVMLSILINQALTTEEMKILEVTHVKLKSGKIEIPGGKHRNGRTLKLESHQILELQEYILSVRPKLLKNKTDQLFISVSGSDKIKNSLYHLMRALNKINPAVKHARQIRQSVIAEWLKTEDVRKVQYKAGHRYVSTTERYQVNNLEELEEALNEHHPLK